MASAASSSSELPARFRLPATTIAQPATTAAMATATALSVGEVRQRRQSLEAALAAELQLLQAAESEAEQRQLEAEQAERETRSERAELAAFRHSLLEVARAHGALPARAVAALSSSDASPVVLAQAELHAAERERLTAELQSLGEAPQELRAEVQQELQLQNQLGAAHLRVATQLPALEAERLRLQRRVCKLGGGYA
eukprot:TRINITY_DN16136_c0_g1_i2.p1 TRINITY_DN16136_c0_g1~~TRINITY_DN16136_c0_g1_i2.p1  ORF type:complete len:198 (-),score=61.73 TRINITY_DN16136_c0_g1_i2:77-670(-)